MMATQPTGTTRKPALYLSLRWQMLIMFGLLLSAGFFGAFYWFYNFATDQALNRIKADLQTTLEGAIAGIDGDQFEQITQMEAGPSGVPENEPLYDAHQQWLADINLIEKRASPYTFVDAHNGREVYWIGDIFRILYPDDATTFKEPYDSQDSLLYDGLSGIVIRPKPYEDQWGQWISAYGPIKNSAGEVVGGVGIDFEANHWYEVRDKVREGIAIALIVGYTSLAIFVLLLANLLTRPIRQLTQVAAEIGEGKYDQDMTHLTQVRVSDEIDTLAGVIEIMVGKVAQREQKLKAQVAELQIMIDDSKRQEQVQEIVDSDFFRDLQDKAKKMRRDFKAADTANAEAAPSSEDKPSEELPKTE